MRKDFVIRITKIFFISVIIFFGAVFIVNAEEQRMPAVETIPESQPEEIVLKSRPLTLHDCYALSLKQSEIVAIDAELVKQAEARFLKYFGAILPQVSFSWTQTNQDSSFSPLGKNSSDQSQFTFTQALFTGFKEFSGMKASRFEQDQYREQKRRAEQLLFVDVADAFYLFLQYQEDIKVLESIWAALSDRVTELKKREEIGRSRQSEVVNTETQLYNIEAQIEAVKGQKIIANELLNFLTGKDVEEVLDNAEVPDIFQEKGYYNKKASNRPDVQAAQYGWRVQKELIGVARADFFPTISLEGDYNPRPKTDNTDWTALLTVSVPIFQGTTTYAQVKEAKSKARAQELEFQRKTRLAFQDINDSFTRAQSAFLQFKAYEKALRSAELNFALQKEDYKRSFVSNLDVLASIQTLGNTRRDYTLAAYERKRRYWQLQISIGEVPYIGEENTP